jgi:hypothetical protein
MPATPRPDAPSPGSAFPSFSAYKADRPRLHLIRFHGMLTPKARLRPEIIPNVPVNVNTPSADHGEVPLIDMEHCSQCGGTLKIIAAAEHAPVIAKILTHLGLPARAPHRATARALDRFQQA